MFQLFQATSVWLSAAMLLAQTVCPSLALGCGCRQANPASCCTASKQSSSCCSGQTKAKQASAGCPHCDKSSHDGESGWQHESVCHCGDHAPPEPPVPQVPNSSEVFELLNGMNGVTACGVVTPVFPIAPVRSQVPSSKALLRNYTQVVYCVWVI